MKVNVGNVDRIVRIVAGLALIGLAVAGTHRSVGIYRSCPATHGVHARMPGLFAAGRQYVLDKHERREITGPIGATTNAPIVRCTETQG